MNQKPLKVTAISRTKEFLRHTFNSTQTMDDMLQNKFIRSLVNQIWLEDLWNIRAQMRIVQEKSLRQMATFISLEYHTSIEKKGLVKIWDRTALLRKSVFNSNYRQENHNKNHQLSYFRHNAPWALWPWLTYKQPTVTSLKRLQNFQQCTRVGSTNTLLKKTFLAAGLFLIEKAWTRQHCRPSWIGHGKPFVHGFPVSM